MRERVRAADSGKGPPISHFGPEANLLAELAETMRTYGATGTGKVRRYIHDAAEAKELGGEPGTFTDWKPMAEKSDVLFYEGLHGGYKDGGVDVAKNVDLLVGVVRSSIWSGSRSCTATRTCGATARTRWSTPSCGACPTT